MCGSQVITKTVAQCVEFYYTYKKHVKIGRNGTLLYGEAEPAESRAGEEDTNHKVGTPMECGGVTFQNITTLTYSFWLHRDWSRSRRKTTGSGKGQLTGNRKQTTPAV